MTRRDVLISVTKDRMEMHEAENLIWQTNGHWYADGALWSRPEEKAEIEFFEHEDGSFRYSALRWFPA